MTDRRKRQSRARTSRDETQRVKTVIDRVTSPMNCFDWINSFCCWWAEQITVARRRRYHMCFEWGTRVEAHLSMTMRLQLCKRLAGSDIISWNHSCVSTHVLLETKTPVPAWDSMLKSLQTSHNSLKVAVIWQISMGRFALFWKQILGCLSSIYHKVVVWLQISSREQ